jgi:hypothetical protein
MINWRVLPVMPGRHSLRGRIVLTIIGSVIATSLIFGLAAFVIAYTMEDRLFRRALVDEVMHQKSSWQRTGALAAPKNPDVTIHLGNEALPPTFRKSLLRVVGRPNSTVAKAAIIISSALTLMMAGQALGLHQRSR